MATEVKTSESWITLGFYGKYRNIEKITVQTRKDWGVSYKGPNVVRLIIDEGYLKKRGNKKMTPLDMRMSRADARSLADALVRACNR